MNISPLPTGENIPEKVLKTLFKKRENEPPQSPTLAHSIMLPLSWQKINDLWVPKPNNGIYPSIQIHATKLTQEISAHNWLRYYVAESKEQILNLQTPSVLFADSLVKFQTPEQVIIKRIAAVIHGSWMILLLGFAQEYDYLALAETFGKAVSSFRLLKPALSPSIEPQTHYQLAEMIEFDCPASWQSKLVSETNIELYHDDAQLKVALSSKQNLEKIIETTLDDFPQMTILELLHSTPLRNFHLLIYQGNFKDQTYELWISCFEYYQHYTVASLLTISRDSDFYQWAVNKRAYGILLESLVQTG
jgi:hypothetical protein